MRVLHSDDCRLAFVLENQLVNVDVEFTENKISGSLVQSVQFRPDWSTSETTSPIILCHKEPAHGIKSPY